MNVKTHHIFLKPMPLLKIACNKESLSPESLWLLKNNINGYKDIESNELSTQAISGRNFKILPDPNLGSSNKKQKRIKVLLLEDGYICWFNLEDLVDQIQKIDYWNPKFLTKNQINSKLSKVLIWIEKASKSPNHYLWGGTTGPNFDCSGLIQTAFSSESIWIPRDAYQQEQFCKRIEFNINTLDQLIPGDLLFFGYKKKCTHVGIYKDNGEYWHSSGKKDGRDGIGIDSLSSINKNAISSHYLSILRGAGRVESCHNGRSLL